MSFFDRVPVYSQQHSSRCRRSQERVLSFTVFYSVLFAQLVIAGAWFHIKKNKKFHWVSHSDEIVPIDGRIFLYFSAFVLLSLLSFIAIAFRDHAQDDNKKTAYRRTKTVLFGGSLTVAAYVIMTRVAKIELPKFEFDRGELITIGSSAVVLPVLFQVLALWCDRLAPVRRVVVRPPALAIQRGAPAGDDVVGIGQPNMHDSSDETDSENPEPEGSPRKCA